jgi:3alpha(or 20beta)-hydroxysteroid dehydrogenase
MSSQGKLAGKVALITGSAGGQGAAAARLFVAEGAQVVLTDVRDDGGESLAGELGEAATYQRLDVSDAGDWTAAVAHALAVFGRLDVLVNNAGINLTASLEETAEADFMRLVEVNQLGPWLGARAALPAMRLAGGGAIVNVGSIGSLTGLASKSAYLSTKWALRGLTQCLAAELGADGVRVNCVHPGGVATAMTAGVSADAFERLPLPRLGRPEEIARAVLFLACDDSSYCTGSELVVDGGKLAAALETPSQPATLALTTR